jgi:hypothetical protein
MEEAELFRAPTDGWTDRHDEDNIGFSQFCERAYKCFDILGRLFRTVGKFPNAYSTVHIMRGVKIQFCRQTLLLIVTVMKMSRGSITVVVMVITKLHAAKQELSRSNE